MDFQQFNGILGELRAERGRIDKAIQALGLLGEIVTEVTPVANGTAKRKTTVCGFCHTRKPNQGFFLHQLYCTANPERPKNIRKRNKALARAAHA